MNPGRVAVAMSGGVDSSTVAALLRESGHEVIGITMRLWRPASTQTPEPAEDAARVAAHLGIPHHSIDLRDDFYRDVIDYFVDEYRQGRTPNPCAHCNRLLKFGRLLQAATELGATQLATGHYVRLTQDATGCPHLRKGADPGKDQSYFLFGLTREQLTHLQFPLGELTKNAVRQEAARLGLPVADKGESQDVCFIPDNDYIGFLESTGGIVPTSGPCILADGRTVGRHDGIHRFTIGQRRGLGIAWSEPLYVTGINADANAVYVGTRSELQRNGLIAGNVNWLIPQPSSLNATCKIRYRHTPVGCHVQALEGQRVSVTFSTPQTGVTPGQAVVFYEGDEVLGGGWIEAGQ